MFVDQVKARYYVTAEVDGESELKAICEELSHKLDAIGKRLGWVLGSVKVSSMTVSKVNASSETTWQYTVIDKDWNKAEKNSPNFKVAKKR